MRLEDVKKLHFGDQVYWNDPDGSCSRILQIRKIEIWDNGFGPEDTNSIVASIEEIDGSYIECYLSELE